MADDDGLNGARIARLERKIEELYERLAQEKEDFAKYRRRSARELAPMKYYSDIELAKAMSKSQE